METNGAPNRHELDNALDGLAHSHNPYYRARCVWVLEALGAGDDRVVRALTQAATSDDSPDVRKAAGQAMTAVDDVGAVLMGLTLDKGDPASPLDPKHAAERLAKIGAGDDRVIPALIKALERDPFNDAARDSLEALGGTIPEPTDGVVARHVQARKEKAAYRATHPIRSRIETLIAQVLVALGISIGVVFLLAVVLVVAGVLLTVLFGVTFPRTTLVLILEWLFGQGG